MSGGSGVIAAAVFCAILAVGAGIWAHFGVRVSGDGPRRVAPEPPLPPPLPQAASPLTRKGRPGPSEVPNIPKPEIKGVPAQNDTPWMEQSVPPPPAETPGMVARGKELYDKACAYCHGADGRGLAPGALESRTTVKDMSAPVSFVIRTSAIGTVPFDADLYRTYYRGLPGTEMPAYRDLPASDLWALVMYSKTLSLQYRDPGKAPRSVYVPAAAPSDFAPLLQEGERLYVDLDCIRCHGEAGRGGTVPMVDSEGQPFATTDFVSDGGVFLVGMSPRDIARTYLIGMPDTPMESYQEKLYRSKDDPSKLPAAFREAGDRKLWALVGHTLRLVKAAKPK